MVFVDALGLKGTVSIAEFSEFLPAFFQNGVNLQNVESVFDFLEGLHEFDALDCDVVLELSLALDCQGFAALTDGDGIASGDDAAAAGIDAVIAPVNPVRACGKLGAYCSSGTPHCVLGG